MSELLFHEIREQKSLFGVSTDMEVESDIEEHLQPKSLFDDDAKTDEESVSWPSQVENSQRCKSARFWQRIIKCKPANSHKVFNWTFGVVLPLICMMADPMIFKGSGLVHGIPTLGFAKPFAYLLSFVSITMMAGWLTVGQKFGRFGAAVAGLFFVGSAVSLAVGILILPFSIIGMFFLIGFLGYTPFLSAFVYFLNGLHAYRSADRFAEKRLRLAVAALTGLFSLVVPYVVNVQINHYLEEMAHADVATIYSRAEKIKYVAPLIDFHVLAGKYCEAPNQPEHQALADVYSTLTGHSLEEADYPICNDF